MLPHGNVGPVLQVLQFLKRNQSSGVECNISPFLKTCRADKVCPQAGCGQKVIIYQLLIECYAIILQMRCREVK